MLRDAVALFIHKIKVPAPQIRGFSALPVTGLLSVSIPVHAATGMETSRSILELAGPLQSIRGAFLGPNFRKPSEQLGAAQQKALAALCLPSCRPLAARKRPRHLPGAAVPLFFPPFAARLRNSARCGHLHARPDRVPDLSRQQDSSPRSPRCPSLILPARVAGPKGSGSLNPPQFPFLPPQWVSGTAP